MMETMMCTSDEARLVQSAARGSVESLGRLYAIYGPDVYRVAYRITGCAADAEDVLQDVFVGLPRALRRFEDGRALGPWLRQIATHVSLNWLRSRDRRHQREAVAAAEHAQVASPPEPNSKTRMQDALARLPDPLRAVLALRLEGYTHEEIGALLSISPGASATRHARALNHLRKDLRS